MTTGLAASRSPSPDWNAVQFPVGCPRCGTDLRGQSDATCPKCALAFDWADLVPVDELKCATCGYRLFGLTETRCPECGAPFTWSDALLDWHCRQLSIVEYWWKSRFLRSSYRTWRMTLRPGKLWQTIGLHHVPRLKPLFGFVVLSLAWSWLGWMACDLIGQIVEAIYEWRMFAPSVSLSDTLFTALSSLKIELTWEPQVVLFLVAWMGALCLSLMLFTQSMRRLGLKLHHLVRVWAYSFTPWLPFTFMIHSCGISLQFGAAMYSGWIPNVAGWCMGFCQLWYLLSTTWSIRQGLAHYIGMRHALAVAISVQLIAIMAAMFASLVPELWRSM